MKMPLPSTSSRFIPHQHVLKDLNHGFRDTLNPVYTKALPYYLCTE